MPELNVLCGMADFSTQSEQPLTKHLVAEVLPAPTQLDRPGASRCRRLWTLLSRYPI